MTGDQAMAEIKTIVDRRIVESAEWYSALSAVREVVEEWEQQ